MSDFIETNGGIRLIYSGSGTSATSIPANVANGMLPITSFNSGNDKSEYVGYMYTLGEQHGHDVSSNIKNALDSWYTSSNLSSFESYINADAVYCSDRSVDGAWLSTPISDMDYAARQRVNNNKYPSHKCGADVSGGYYENDYNRLQDRFSATTYGGGNGYLSNPIALMTADEASFAGALVGTNSNTWLVLNDEMNSITPNSVWFNISPNYYRAGYSIYNYNVYGNQYLGSLGNAEVSTERGVRPVISLKPNVLIENGNGTISNPYIVYAVDDIKYWTDNYSVKLYTNSVPSNSQYSFVGLKKRKINDQSASFAKSYIHSDFNVTHEVCVNYLNKTYCVGQDYFEIDSTTTASKLRNDISSKLNVNPSCTIFSEPVLVSCEFGGYQVNVYEVGESNVYDALDGSHCRARNKGADCINW